MVRSIWTSLNMSVDQDQRGLGLGGQGGPQVRAGAVGQGGPQVNKFEKVHIWSLMTRS